VPLDQSIEDYFAREVLPQVPNAWIDRSKCDAQDGEVGIVGYEIPFNRHFYVFTPPRALGEIDADLKQCTDRIKQMIEGLSV
jgi:type I restriction enzyme M protein